MSTILKFKAGRVHYNQETNLLSPEALKGEVSIKPSEEDDSFYDFIWTPRERTAGNSHDPEDDDNRRLLIPGDVEWKHVKSCKTGRVFCLQFTSDAKSFYWLQDPNENEDDPSELSAKDKEISNRINKLLTEEDEEDEADDDDEVLPDAPEAEKKEQHTNAGSSLPIIDINKVFKSSVFVDYVKNKLDDEEKLNELVAAHVPKVFFEDYSEETKDTFDISKLSTEQKKQALIQVLTSTFYSGAQRKLSMALAKGAGAVVSQALHLGYAGEGVENFLDAVRKQGLKEREEEEAKRNPN